MKSHSPVGVAQPVGAQHSDRHQIQHRGDGGCRQERVEAQQIRLSAGRQQRPEEKLRPHLCLGACDMQNQDWKKKHVVNNFF